MTLKDEALSFLKNAVKSRLSTETKQAVDIFKRVKDRASVNYQGSAIRSGGVLDAALSRPDPLLGLNWRCDLPIIDSTNQLDWSRVEEANLPFVEFEQVSNYRAGKMFHYPHHYTLGVLTLKLYEDSFGSALSYLNEWKRLMLDGKTGLYNVPSVYKKPVKITIYDSSFRTVMFLTYIGCWIPRHDPYTLSGETQRINPSVEVSVDDVELSFGKFNDGEIPSLIDKIGSEFPPRITDLPDLFPNNFIKFNLSNIF